MNLASLKTVLETTENTDIKKVAFDFNTILNEDFDKEYPYVLWDLDNSKWTKDIRDTNQTVTMDVFILGKFEQDVDEKIDVWDEIEAQLDEYLLVIHGLNNTQLFNDKVDKEYYPAGLLSVDGEVGMRYRITLKLWC